jgi:hypothetical protein
MAARRTPKGRKRGVSGGFIKKLPPATSKKGGGNKSPGQVTVKGYTRRGSGKMSTPVAVKAYVRAGGGRAVGGGAAPKRPRKSSQGTGTMGVPTYGGPVPKLKQKGSSGKLTGTMGRPKFSHTTIDSQFIDPGLPKKLRQQRARKAKHAVGRRSGGKSW